MPTARRAVLVRVPESVELQASSGVANEQTRDSIKLGISELRSHRGIVIARFFVNKAGVVGFLDLPAITFDIFPRSLLFENGILSGNKYRRVSAAILHEVFMASLGQAFELKVKCLHGRLWAGFTDSSRRLLNGERKGVYCPLLCRLGIRRSRDIHRPVAGFPTSGTRLPQLSRHHKIRVMTAQSLIAGIRKKLETSKGGFRTPETTRWIAVVIGGLRQELPRAQSDIKILETRLSIFFSPRRHKKLQVAFSKPTAISFPHLIG